MTEKQYGGATGRSSGGISKDIPKPAPIPTPSKNKILEIETNEVGNSEDYLKAGEISKEVKQFAHSIIKKNVPLVEIADKVEAKIIELGAGIAFPINLSINEIAAHYTPSYDDKTLAHGLLKVDIGIHVNGCVADSAFSLDLENSEENKKIIHASEEALKNALAFVKKNKEKAKLSDIGETIQRSIENLGLNPITNLSGHSLEQYEIHAGITIPNCKNNNLSELNDGAFAVEPFSTNGIGYVNEGKPSGIFMLQKPGNVRDATTRKILDYIKENYKTLPFASRWLVKEFGTRAIISLSLLKQQGILHEFNQLVEKSKGIVAQSEDSFIVFNGDFKITTA